MALMTVFHCARDQCRLNLRPLQDAISTLRPETRASDTQKVDNGREPRALLAWLIGAGEAPAQQFEVKTHTLRNG